MILARVVGQVVSTMKRPQFEGAKLLLVQPETPGGEARGNTLLAIPSKSFRINILRKSLIQVETLYLLSDGKYSMGEGYLLPGPCVS